MEELELCPFCDSEAILLKGGSEGYFINCTKCECSLGYCGWDFYEETIGSFDSKKDAKYIWNNRPNKEN